MQGRVFVVSRLTSHSGHTTVTFDHVQNQLTVRNHATSIQHVLAVPALSSLFSLPPSPSHTLVIGITKDSSIVQIHVPSSSATISSPVLYSNTSLPLPAAPRFILPVDPMAWGSHTQYTQHDVLVSISAEGELSFWNPDPETSTSLASDRGKWQCTGSVHTGRKDIRMARCSSAKKTVLGTLKSYFFFAIILNMYFSCPMSRWGRADDMGFQSVGILFRSRVPACVQVLHDSALSFLGLCY